MNVDDKRSYQHAGDRLYDVGKQKNRIKQDYLNQQRHIKVLTELDQATFHPATNHYDQKRQARPETALLEYGASSKVKK